MPVWPTKSSASRPCCSSTKRPPAWMSRPDREMMDLFRSLAKAGETVVLCDRTAWPMSSAPATLVVILTAGAASLTLHWQTGRGALTYFGIEAPGRCLRPPRRTAGGPLAAGVSDKSAMAALRWRSLAVRGWKQVGPPQPRVRSAGRLNERLRLLLRQTVLLTRRYAAIWRGDYLSLLAMAGQAAILVVALLLGLAVRRSGQGQGPRTCSSINQSDVPAGGVELLVRVHQRRQGIVKERTIYTREPRFQLMRVESYYASKSSCCLPASAGSRHCCCFYRRAGVVRTSRANRELTS